MSYDFSTLAFDEPGEIRSVENFFDGLALDAVLLAPVEGRRRQLGLGLHGVVVDLHLRTEKVYGSQICHYNTLRNY